MTYEEALDRFQATLTECSIWCKENQLTEMFRTAIKALEKQIPKKPWKGADGWSYCECGHWFDEPYDVPHCPSCGQCLDWSNEK